MKKQRKTKEESFKNETMRKAFRGKRKMERDHMIYEESLCFLKSRQIFKDSVRFGLSMANYMIKTEEICRMIWLVCFTGEKSHKLQTYGRD